MAVACAGYAVLCWQGVTRLSCRLRLLICMWQGPPQGWATHVLSATRCIQPEAQVVDLCSPL
jgi:hypothetical protein